LRADEVTPAELLDATLDRVERLDGTINAVITSYPDRARDHAARIDPSTATGRFAGVPALSTFNPDDRPNVC
jgi:amidase